jgi:hypothetical protein
MERLLTNITIYWVTGNINSSTRLYRGFFYDGGSDAMKFGQKIDSPLRVWLPLNDIYPPPPSS